MRGRQELGLGGRAVRLCRSPLAGIEITNRRRVTEIEWEGNEQRTEIRSAYVVNNEDCERRLMRHGYLALGCGSRDLQTHHDKKRNKGNKMGTRPVGESKSSHLFTLYGYRCKELIALVKSCINA